MNLTSRLTPRLRSFERPSGYAIAALLGCLVALTNTAPVAAAGAPAVTMVTAGGLQKAVAAHRGHLVMVNFWATWCAPCVAELPTLAALQKQEAGKGLVLLLVSADDTGSLPDVKRTLTTKGQSASFLLTGNMPDFFAAFVPSDKGTIALPRSYVYNRRGQLVATVPMDHTLAQYKQILKPYL